MTKLIGAFFYRRSVTLRPCCASAPPATSSGQHLSEFKNSGVNQKDARRAPILAISAAAMLFYDTKMGIAR
jgi:hypothetical protein